MSIRLRHILVPVDFSETSDDAFDHAISLARAFDAELHVLHVLEDPFLYAPTTAQQFRDEFEAEQRQRLDALMGKHGVEGVKLSSTMQPGTAFYEIIQYAKNNDTDLIVIGSHGHGLIAHMLLGSVAEKVIRKAPCPVLTVRPGQHEFVMP